MAYVLYKWPAGWDLPSVSVACLEVEAYLRLARATTQIQECSSVGASPSGQLPALDSGHELVSTPGADDQEAAQAILQFLRSSGLDIDAQLEEGQQALCAAFGALVQLHLRPATQYATWCEPESFSKHTRAAYGAGLPVPLNYLITWKHRRSVMGQLAALTADQVYANAAAAYAALASHLSQQAGINDGSSAFFFGDRPSSLDASLFAHLAFHLSSPISPPQLQRKAASHPELVRFTERMFAHVFASPLPPAPPISSPEWAARDEAAASTSAAARAAARARRQRQEKEDQMKRQGRLWLAGVAVVLIGFVLVTGQHISFRSSQYEEDELDEEED